MQETGIKSSLPQAQPKHFGDTFQAAGLPKTFSAVFIEKQFHVAKAKGRCIKMMLRSHLFYTFLKMFTFSPQSNHQYLYCTFVYCIHILSI